MIDAQHECEQQLALLASRKHVLLAPRATTALVALFRALGLPPGSEVLMPVMLCANPAYAVRWAGLCPLFADVSPFTFNLDLDAAEAVVGPNTRALLAVPLFGHPLDVPALLDFAERHHLLIIEDAAQAVGLSYYGHPAGSLGVCSVYSFGPGKIADAGGGAALLSDDADLLARARSELAAMPSAPGRKHTQPDRILEALQELPAELEARIGLAHQYRQMLTHSGITHPQVTPSLPLWKYSVLLPTRRHRDLITRELLSRGVPATNLYPPLSPFFPESRKNATRDYPVAQGLHDGIINLPLWPQPPNLLENVATAFEAL